MANRRGGRTNRVGAVEVLHPQPHRSFVVQALLVAWRWLFELALIAGLILLWVNLDDEMPQWAVACVVIAPITLGMQIPWVRRQIVGWFCVLFVRHRLRTALVELGAYNRSGKLPWLVTWRPTPIGERVWLLMVAGLSMQDVADRAETIAAACMAREARIDRARRFAMFVKVDVIRRDPLESKKPIRSRLMGAPVKGMKADADLLELSPTIPPARGEADWLNTPIPAQPKQPAKPGGSNRGKSTQDTKAADTDSAVLVNGEDLSDYV